jgi:hypothetical protein
MLRTSDRNDNPSVSNSTIVPPHVAALFGTPPVLSTENRQAYEQLFVELALEWGPRDTTEWMFVRDMTDISWEMLRLRRVIANVLNIATKEGIAGIFMDVLPGCRRSLTREDCEAYIKQSTKAEARADDWFEGPEKREGVKSELAKYDLGTEAIAAQAHIAKAAELERLDRMLTTAVLRRAAVMRSFHEHQAMAALKQSAAVDNKQVRLLPQT